MRRESSDNSTNRKSRDQQMELSMAEFELNRISPALAILLFLCALLTAFWRQW